MTKVMCLTSGKQTNFKICNSAVRKCKQKTHSIGNNPYVMSHRALTPLTVCFLFAKRSAGTSCKQRAKRQ